jgi:hypothetical protein
VELEICDILNSSFELEDVEILEKFFISTYYNGLAMEYYDPCLLLDLGKCFNHPAGLLVAPQSPANRNSSNWK